MRRLVWMCALILAAMPIAAGAAETKSGTTSSGKPRFEASQKVTAEATVLSVNKTKRTVKLATESGDTVSVECGKEVKNFNQIQVKDVVTITYTEKLTIEVGAPDAAAASGSEPVQTTTAKAGEKPKATMTSKTQYRATITAIDKAAGTVSLKGEDGREATVTPRNPANLDKVQVGDVVLFTYSEALAASVTKSGDKSANK